MYVSYLEKVGEHRWIIPAAQPAPLRNGNAAAKCLNDAAQKEKNGSYSPLNDRPLQIRSGAALPLIYTPSSATLL